MAWARIDDGFDDHPKVIELNDLAAVGLWTLCLTWCHRRRQSGEVQGYIPHAVVRRFGGSDELAGRLVDARLWHAPGHGCDHPKCPPIKDGWLIHDYQDYLPTATRHARSEAGKKGAEARWGRAQKNLRGISEESQRKPETGKQPVADSDFANPQDAMASSHDVAIESHGKPIANYGSRAHARRVQVVGTTGSDPEPEAIQKASPSAGETAGLSVTQRSKKITDAYSEAEPMSKWPAVNGIVIKAIKSERYSDDEILAAVLRLAAEKRSVTVDSLRTELDGFTPRGNGAKPATTDVRVQEALSLLEPGA